MLSRIECYYPNSDDLSVLFPHHQRLKILSGTFSKTVDGGTCILPECIKVYGALAVAFEDEVAVGFTAIKDYPGGEWVLTAAFVEEQHRNTGLGSKMLDELVKYARKAGAKRIVTHTKSPNMVAILTRMGFTITSDDHASGTNLLFNLE